MSNYAKAILAIVVSAAGALVTALGTGATSIGDISTKSWLLAALTVLGSGGLVWFTENVTEAPVIKAVIAFLTAGISSLVVALNDNVISQAELLTAFSAAVVATGFVFQIKNTNPPAAKPASTHRKTAA